MKLRGITASLALGAALSGAAGATAGAAPLRLEPSPITEPAPVAEDFTSNGSSTISASVNAKGACLFQRTLSAMDLDC
ncbi:hypothetical protein [Nocardia sp. NPDC024068]|uniref:hypothetical protein n=1 Tax=Nocardia sp. NPDC024068 TaxID=3157197 RepID=UPI0033C348EB